MTFHLTLIVLPHMLTVCLENTRKWNDVRSPRFPLVVVDDFALGSMSTQVASYIVCTIRHLCISEKNNDNALSLFFQIANE